MNDPQTMETENVAVSGPQRVAGAKRSDAPAVFRATRVLFVCVENSNRSQMAEALARMQGSEELESYSAGSRPSGRVNPKAIDSMNELGYDLSAHRSKSLDEIPSVEFDAAVTMGCGDACPHVAACRREDWNIPDPKAMPPEEFNKVRDLIAKKVRALLTSLFCTVDP